MTRLQRHIMMFTLSFGTLLISALNSLEALAQIPTDSIDYWIGNISPRCAINIIYYQLTNDFTFNSAHNIPVMLVPLKYYDTLKSRRKFLKNLYNSSIRFMKAECYFSVLYYKPLNNDKISSNIDLMDINLFHLITHIAYGFIGSEKYDSNLTNCLILYYGNELNDEENTFQGLIEDEMEINLGGDSLSNLRSNFHLKVHLKVKVRKSGIHELP